MIAQLPTQQELKADALVEITELEARIAELKKEAAGYR